MRPRATKVEMGHAGKLISDCELSVRTLDCFKKAGLTILGEVSAMTDKELLEIPFFGRKSLNEIRQCLHDHGDPEALYRISLEEGAEKIKRQIFNLQVSLAVIELQLARDHSDPVLWEKVASDVSKLIQLNGDGA